MSDTKRAVEGLVPHRVARWAMDDRRGVRRGQECRGVAMFYWLVDTGTDQQYVVCIAAAQHARVHIEATLPEFSPFEGMN